MDRTPVVGVLENDGEAYARALRDGGLAATDFRVLDVEGGTDDANAAGIEVCLAQPDRLAAVSGALPALRWVQSTWAGVGPLLPVLRARPELIATTPKGVFGGLMAEYVLAALLMHGRDFPQYQRDQAARRWAQRPVRRLAGRRLVVLGVGSIGAEVAAAARGLGMHVTGVSRSGAPVPGLDAVVPVDALVDAADGADALAVLVPDTPATRGLVDARVLAALAPGAVLVNGGRGPVIDDAALIASLEGGHLGGAVLDVFDEEPLPAEHALWATEGVLITPHVAAPSDPAAIAGAFLDNLARWRAGAALVGIVDPALGY